MSQVQINIANIATKKNDSSAPPSDYDLIGSAIYDPIYLEIFINLLKHDEAQKNLEGLIRFRRQIQHDYESLGTDRTAGDYTLLEQYFLTSPEAKELFGVWELICKQEDPNSRAGYELLFSNLMEIFSMVFKHGKRKEIRYVLNFVARKIIKDYLFELDSRFKGTKADADTVLCHILRTLTGIVLSDSYSARDLAALLLKTHGLMSVTTLLRKSAAWENERLELRDELLRFWVSFLQTADSDLIASLAGQEEYASALFNAIAKCRTKVQQECIATFYKVLLNQYLPKYAKRQLFKFWCLSRLLPLYKSEKLGSVVHQFLMEALCSPQHSLCVIEKYHHNLLVADNANFKNRSLLNFLSKIDIEDPKQVELLLACYNTCPEIVTRHMRQLELPNSLTSVPELTLMATLNLILKFLKLPLLPLGSLVTEDDDINSNNTESDETQIDLSRKTKAETVINNIFPACLTRSILATYINKKGESYSVITFLAIQVVYQMFLRMEAFFKQLRIQLAESRERGSSIVTNEENALAALEKQVLTKFAYRVPDAAGLIRIAKRSSETDSFLRARVLGLLRMYQRHLPEETHAVQNLPKVLIESKPLSECSPSEIYHTLSMILEEKKYFDWNASFSIFKNSFLQFIVEENPATLGILRRLLHAIMRDTGLFNGNEDEIDLWISSTTSEAMSNFIARNITNAIRDISQCVSAITALSKRFAMLADGIQPEQPVSSFFVFVLDSLVDNAKNDRITTDFFAREHLISRVMLSLFHSKTVASYPAFAQVIEERIEAVDAKYLVQFRGVLEYMKSFPRAGKQDGPSSNEFNLDSSTPLLKQLLEQHVSCVLSNMPSIVQVPNSTTPVIEFLYARIDYSILDYPFFLDCMERRGDFSDADKFIRSLPFDILFSQAVRSSHLINPILQNYVLHALAQAPASSSAHQVLLYLNRLQRASTSASTPDVEVRIQFSFQILGQIVAMLPNNNGEGAHQLDHTVKAIFGCSADAMLPSLFNEAKSNQGLFALNILQLWGKSFQTLATNSTFRECWADFETVLVRTLDGGAQMDMIGHGLVPVAPYLSPRTHACVLEELLDILNREQGHGNTTLVHLLISLFPTTEKAAATVNAHILHMLMRLLSTFDFAANKNDLGRRLSDLIFERVAMSVVAWNALHHQRDTSSTILERRAGEDFLLSVSPKILDMCLLGRTGFALSKLASLLVANSALFANKFRRFISEAGDIVDQAQLLNITPPLLVFVLTHSSASAQAVGTSSDDLACIARLASKLVPAIVALVSDQHGDSTKSNKKRKHQQPEALSTLSDEDQEVVVYCATMLLQILSTICGAEVGSTIPSHLRGLLGISDKDSASSRSASLKPWTTKAEFMFCLALCTLPSSDHDIVHHFVVRCILHLNEASPQDTLDAAIVGSLDTVLSNRKTPISISYLLANYPQLISQFMITCVSKGYSVSSSYWHLLVSFIKLANSNKKVLEEAGLVAAFELLIGHDDFQSVLYAKGAEARTTQQPQEAPVSPNRRYLQQLDTLYRNTESHAAIRNALLTETAGFKGNDVLVLLEVLLATLANITDTVLSRHSQLVLVLLSAYSATLSAKDRLLFEIFDVFERRGVHLEEYDYLWGAAAKERLQELSNKAELDASELDPEVYKAKRTAIASKIFIDSISNSMMSRSYELFPLSLPLAVSPTGQSKSKSSYASSVLETQESDESIYDPRFMLRCILNCILRGGAWPRILITSCALSFAICAMSSLDLHMRMLGYEIVAQFVETLPNYSAQQEANLILFNFFRNGISKQYARIPSMSSLLIAKAVHIFMRPETPTYRPLADMVSKRAAMKVFDVPPLFYDLFKFEQSVHSVVTINELFESQRLFITLAQGGIKSVKDMTLYKDERILENLMTVFSGATTSHDLHVPILQTLYRACAVPAVAEHLITNSGLLLWLRNIALSHAQTRPMIFVAAVKLLTFIFEAVVPHFHINSRSSKLFTTECMLICSSCFPLLECRDTVNLKWKVFPSVCKLLQKALPLCIAKNSVNNVVFSPEQLATLINNLDHYLQLKSKSSSSSSAFSSSFAFSSTYETEEELSNCVCSIILSNLELTVASYHGDSHKDAVPATTATTYLTSQDDALHLLDVLSWCMQALQQQQQHQRHQQGPRASMLHSFLKTLTALLMHEPLLCRLMVASSQQQQQRDKRGAIVDILLSLYQCVPFIPVEHELNHIFLVILSHTVKSASSNKGVSSWKTRAITELIPQLLEHWTPATEMKTAAAKNACSSSEKLFQHELNKEIANVIRHVFHTATDDAAVPCLLPSLMSSNDNNNDTNNNSDWLNVEAAVAAIRQRAVIAAEQGLVQDDKKEKNKKRKRSDEEENSSSSSSSDDDDDETADDDSDDDDDTMKPAPNNDSDSSDSDDCSDSTRSSSSDSDDDDNSSKKKKKQGKRKKKEANNNNKKKKKKKSRK